VRSTSPGCVKRRIIIAFSSSY